MKTLTLFELTPPAGCQHSRRRQGDARSQRREVQEVTAGLRQILDLRLADAGSDRCGANFGPAAQARYHDFIAGGSRRREIDVDDLTDREGDLLRLLPLRLDAIGAGTQADDREAAVGAGGGRYRPAGDGVGDGHGATRARTLYAPLQGRGGLGEGGGADHQRGGKGARGNAADETRTFATEIRHQSAPLNTGSIDLDR
ncbi:hypothetical protein DdX_19879 [Ditylenchus destructor]|uniref:Uncharacterized protein n=1 Tax=Ditylenchus destructor TaxID=166010 RepID=A0AAD4MH32_9BILA|nr:hypothetical protein DdX_19879 [Ditylenchus destructor]